MSKSSLSLIEGRPELQNQHLTDLVINLEDFLVAHGFIKFLEGKKGEKIKGKKERAG